MLSGRWRWLFSARRFHGSQQTARIHYEPFSKGIPESGEAQVHRCFRSEISTMVTVHRGVVVRALSQTAKWEKSQAWQCLHDRPMLPNRQPKHCSIKGSALPRNQRNSHLPRCAGLRFMGLAQLQQCRQLTMESALTSPRLTPVYREHDRVDQAPQGRCRLVAARGFVQRRLEIGDFPAIDLDKVGVQGGTCVRLQPAPTPSCSSRA